MNAYVMLIQKWKNTCVGQVGDEKLESDFKDYFKGFESDLTKEIIHMYHQFQGMPDSCYDEHEFSFWNYEKALTESRKRFPSGEAFCFADFLIESIVYAIVIGGDSPGEIRIVSNGQCVEKVANSIHDFFNIYVCDRSKLGIAL